MTTEQIKQLLDKYWACETSSEDENVLKVFFSADNLPKEMEKYKSLFLWKVKQLQVKGNQTPQAGFKKPVFIQFYPFLKAAASILLLFTLGIGIYTHYQQEKYMDSVFSETYSDPEDALRETKNVIGRVSSALNLAKDRRLEIQKTDSLKENPLNNTIEK